MIVFDFRKKYFNKSLDFNQELEKMKLTRIQKIINMMQIYTLVLTFLKNITILNLIKI